MKEVGKGRVANVLLCQIKSNRLTATKGMWEENICSESGNTNQGVDGIFSAWVLEKRFNYDWKLYICLRYLQENTKVHSEILQETIKKRKKKEKGSGTLKSLALCQQLKEKGVKLLPYKQCGK